MLKFLKSRSKLKLKRVKIKVAVKCPVTRNTHMKYENPITYHSKDMTNVKIFAYRQTGRITNKQRDRHTGQILYFYMPPIF
jgi:hypothetical protein